MHVSEIVEGEIVALQVGQVEELLGEELDRQGEGEEVGRQAHDLQEVDREEAHHHLFA